MKDNEDLFKIGRETRNEFYTNYPFFKYWKTDHSFDFVKPKPLNIYVHIPFCAQICDFCYYNKSAMNNKEEVQEYVDMLCKEIELMSSVTDFAKRPVDSIYFGGGTPSLLSAKQFDQICDTLRKYHKIVSPEFTIETAPGTFNQKKIDAYIDNRVNRVSVGVQSFDNEVIKLSSRTHKVEQVYGAFRRLKTYDDLIINIDLLSGLAGDTLDKFLDSVDQAIDNEIDMITIYKMKTYTNTTFFDKAVRKKEIILPSAEQELEFMENALQKMKDSNYHFWSTYAFTKKSYSHTYIERTWRGDDCVSYGVSAFGNIGGVMYQNYNGNKLYVDSIKENKLPIYRKYNLSIKDQIVREILLCGVRLYSYSVQEFIDKYGFDYTRLIAGTMDQLEERGFLVNTESGFVLTDKGILYSDFLSMTISESVKERLQKDEINFVY